VLIFIIMKILITEPQYSFLLEQNEAGFDRRYGLQTEGPGGQTTDGCPPNFYKNAKGQCVPEYDASGMLKKLGQPVQDNTRPLPFYDIDKIVAQQRANGTYIEGPNNPQAEFRVDRSNKYQGLVTKNKSPKIDPYLHIIDRERKREKAEQSEDIINYYKQNAHTINTVLQIATAFIPLVGPFISAGIGLADAKRYYDEGDTKTAGLVGVFSCIPGVGGLANKLGLTKWTSKALSEIGKKISFSQKLSPLETQVANTIAKNKQLIQSEMAKIGASATIKTGAEMARATLKKQAKKQLIKNTTKTLAGYGAVGAGYSKGYDYVQRNTPKTKAEKEKIDWEFVKNSFGSSGSKEDNVLLNNAWNGGWRPGTAVPKQFQTALYQKENNEEQENLKKLEAMIASIK